MASNPSLPSIDLSLGPDLHPLYPNPTQIQQSLSANSGLAPRQKAELVIHCISRACLFADLAVLQYLVSDPQAQAFVDLGVQDEDGLGLISLTIYGFGAESERDVEREECVRFLISQGADVNAADNAGWTPLHHAALRSPPTLISYLLTHGCSLFAVTHRNLTALDIVTAHTIVPGREDVALLLEEAMRGEGWAGGKMEARRRLIDQRIKRRGNRRNVRDNVGRVLGVSPRWWGDVDLDDADSDSDSEEGDPSYDQVYTPPTDYTSMLVFSPPSLPQIFESLINNFQPSLRNAQPANMLYMLARFACLTCDHTWLEDLIFGATDAIEEAFFNRSEDVTCLVFWLYNTTVWLHLMKCDNSINEACEMLGSFELIEEVINSIFVFVIRFAERRIDQLFDAALLDYTPLSSELESVQFESEWSFLRPFSGKKKTVSGSTTAPLPSPLRNGASSPPNTPSARPPSPSVPQASVSSATSRGFSSLRQSFARARGASSSVTPLQSFFSDVPPTPSPADVTSFMTALHTFLTLSEINSALVTQLWSQVMYWTSCEIFNRILTRKKYLCRSRAAQISMNVMILGDWIRQMRLPPGIESHFAPVRALLRWLQTLSSINEFSNLVSTIQTMKTMNPLQMRRTVRDYKYEVNEGKMTEECVQYLTQLQKDWERHRVKLGVDALRKEIGERDRDREDSVSSLVMDVTPGPTSSMSLENSSNQNIDTLFHTILEESAWEPGRPPQVLGELLDSRYMLPLTLPSDPRLLVALPGKRLSASDERRGNSPPNGHEGCKGLRNARSLAWRSQNRKLRDLGVDSLQFVDGIRSAPRWAIPDEDEEDNELLYSLDDSHSFQNGDPHSDRSDAHITPLTQKPSVRVKGRHSHGGEESIIGPP